MIKQKKKTCTLQKKDITGTTNKVVRRMASQIGLNMTFKTSILVFSKSIFYDKNSKKLRYRDR